MSRILVSFMLFFIMNACSSESRLESSAALPVSQSSAVSGQLASEPPETGEPAMHAVQNNRLKQIMDQINSLVYAQLNSEINLSHERQLKAEEIARVARELAASETAIVETLPTLKLSPSEKSTFLALSEKLKTGADQMEQAANRNQLQEVSATMENITSTCTSCHALFRKSRNLLEKCKDPRYTC